MTAKPQTPSVRELRNFGLLMGVFMATIFGLLIPWIWGLNAVTWPWIVGAVFVLWGLSVPATLSPVFAIWMKFGSVIGWFNTRILLALDFSLLFFPLGGIMRLFGWDAMQRKLNSEVISYRISSDVGPQNNMENPF